MRKYKYYFALIGVILIWGLAPNVYKYLLDFYSPAAQSIVGSVVSVLAMLIICRNSLKDISWDYIKVAVPTGLFYSLAVISQKIGLTMTTTARYAFLENTSCLATPLLMIILAKQKPSFLKFFSGALCMVGIYILCGGLGDNLEFGWGEILCGLAGVFYSVNIAGTAAFAKKLDTTLYLFIQFVVQGIVSTIYLFFEANEMKFSWDIKPLLIITLLILISSVVGWIVRTICLKHLDATFISVAMPFSAAITSIISVMVGTDTLSLSLVFGSLIMLVATILSGLSDNKVDNGYSRNT